MERKNWPFILNMNCKKFQTEKREFFQEERPLQETSIRRVRKGSLRGKGNPMQLGPSFSDLFARGEQLRGKVLPTSEKEDLSRRKVGSRGGF